MIDPNRIKEQIKEWRGNFPLFAEQCLKVRDKGSNLTPFRLNTAQIYIHERIEQQRRKYGWVRAIILKGRQQGACLAPDTPVMREDYTWAKIQDIRPGDRLLACDAETGSGKGRQRYMRTATVEASVKRFEPCLKFTLASGRTLTLSEKHRMLSRQRGGTYTQWRRAENFKEGDVIRRVTYPDVVPDHADDGWAGGALDCDGSFAFSKASRVGFSQIDGPVLERYKRWLRDANIGFYESVDRRTKAGKYTKLGDKPVHCVRVDRFADIVRLLGKCRATRFRDVHTGHNLPKSCEGFEAWDTIISIKRVGSLEVYDLQTSTKTFVADGLVSHNSTYVEGRYYWKTTLFRNVSTYIMSHEQTSADAIFSMVDRYHRNNPVAPKTGTSNVKELSFDKLGSSYAVATAGSKASGRGRTTHLFHGCLHPSTYVMRPHGAAVPMSDIKIGDEVITHTGATAKVSYISADEKMLYAVKVMGASDPVLATMGHKFETPRGKVALRDLKAGDTLLHPVTKPGHETIELPYRLNYGARSGKGVHGGGVKSVGPSTLRADFELGRVLGLYIAEGHQRDNAVAFAIHEREVARTLEWLKPFRKCWRSEPKVVRRETSKTVTVHVYSKSFSKFVERHCGRTTRKHVPELWHKNADFARGLAVGYFAGDGGGQHKNGVRVQAPSICPAISFAMRDILAATGYGWPTLTRREGALRSGRTEREQWTVRLSGEGADRLWEDMGREPFVRTRKHYPKKMFIQDGFANVPIQSIKPWGVGPTLDFEVDHPDHSFRIWQCSSSNSEVAFWKAASDHFKASVQSVALEPGTEILLESTANGPDGEFWKRWNDAVRGIGDYIAIFVPWFWTPEYQRDPEPGFRMDTVAEDGELSEAEYAQMYGLNLRQMAWRRNKIIELGGIGAFKQEYPANPDEAFQAADTGSLINSLDILRARKRRVEASGPLILGVDPAGDGGDRFAIAFRRGSKCEKVIFRTKITEPEALAWVKALIDEHKPAAVFIDSGGLGRYLGGFLKADQPWYANVVHQINFGLKSQAKNAYPNRAGPKNRRAEMWERLNRWIQSEEGVQIPDEDDLHADMMSAIIKPEVNNNLLLLSKQEMRAKGMRSPDLADALALTFADMIYVGEWTEKAPRASFDNIDDTVLRTAYADDAPTTFEDGGGHNSWMGF